MKDISQLHKYHHQARELGWIEHDLMAAGSSLEETAHVLARILRDHQTIILLGAGISQSGGLPNASTFVKELSTMLMNQEVVSHLLDSVPEKRKIWSEHLASLEFDSVLGLLKIMDPRTHHRLFNAFLYGYPQEEHLLLLKAVEHLGVSAIFSTNFDTIIEKAAEILALDLRMFAKVDDFPEHPISASPIPLYKIHGGVHESGNHLDIQADFTQIGAERYNRRLQLLRKYSQTHHVLVLGYGGFDYWDIYPLLFEQPSKGLIWITHSEQEVPCITTASQSYASPCIRDNVERLLAFAPGRVRIKCNTQGLLSAMAKGGEPPTKETISSLIKNRSSNNWRGSVEEYVQDRGNGVLVEFGNILAACNDLELAHLAFDQALTHSETLNYVDQGHAFLGRVRSTAIPDSNNLAEASKIAGLAKDTLLSVNVAIETAIAMGNRGDRKGAIKILKKTEKTAEKRDLIAFAALCSANIANQYAKLKEFHLADKAYQRSEQLFRRAGDMPQLFLTLRNHAELHAIEIGNPENLHKALPLYLEALSISWGRHLNGWYKREMYSRVFVIFKFLMPNPSDAIDYVLSEPTHSQSGLAEHIVHRIVEYGYSMENLIMEEWQHDMHSAVSG